jgi:hypothetical protein
MDRVDPRLATAAVDQLGERGACDAAALKPGKDHPPDLEHVDPVLGRGPDADGPSRHAWLGLDYEPPVALLDMVQTAGVGLRDRLGGLRSAQFGHHRRVGLELLCQPDVAVGVRAQVHRLKRMRAAKRVGQTSSHEEGTTMSVSLETPPTPTPDPGPPEPPHPDPAPPVSPPNPELPPSEPPPQI